MIPSSPAEAKVSPLGLKANTSTGRLRSVTAAVFLPVVRSQSVTDLSKPTPVDATHLKFAQGDPTAMFQAVRVVGQLKAEILEYRPQPKS